MAAQKYGSIPNVNFINCTSAEQIDSDHHYEVSICMETFEHLGTEQRKQYLEKLAKITTDYIFVTVPNELGVVFAIKTFIKFFIGNTRTYTFKEFIFQTIGLTKRMNNRKAGHKGFNYFHFIQELSEYFEIHEVSGAPFTLLPAIFNFNVCIVGKKS